MKSFFVFACITVLTFFQGIAQESSLIVLGDIHYDQLENHNMEWLKNKSNDIRQIKEYTKITKENWGDFISVIREKVQSVNPPVKAVIQLGDLSEGLAGSVEKSREMAADLMAAIDEAQMPAPWIIAKGNHDITGPGSKEAFQEFYIPMVQKQTNNSEITSASYSYVSGDIQITCIDPWDKNMDMIAFLEKELTSSDAKFRFIAIHEPVIPVTERCWYVFKNEPEQREKLLQVIAKNKAVVLCGHLHRYSVVSRNTSYGPVVQIMVVSVVKDRNNQKPDEVITSYCPSLAENVPQWQPETLEERKTILSEEANYVRYYKQTDLPGYAIIKTDANKEILQLEYYAAFAKKPFDKIDLAKLLKN